MILTAISIAVLGLAVHQATKAIDYKPFNCELCMTFWTSVFVVGAEWLTPLPIFDFVEYIGLAIFTRQLLFRVWPTMF